MLPEVNHDKENPGFYWFFRNQSSFYTSGHILISPQFPLCPLAEFKSFRNNAGAILTVGTNQRGDMEISLDSIPAFTHTHSSCKSVLATKSRVQHFTHLKSISLPISSPMATSARPRTATLCCMLRSTSAFSLSLLPSPSFFSPSSLAFSLDFSSA